MNADRKRKENEEGIRKKKRRQVKGGRKTGHEKFKSFSNSEQLTGREGWLQFSISFPGSPLKVTR